MTYLVPAALVREATERVARSALPRAPVVDDHERDMPCGPVRPLARARRSELMVDTRVIWGCRSNCKPPLTSVSAGQRRFIGRADRI
jgi:hypothetical protein